MKKNIIAIIFVIISIIVLTLGLINYTSYVKIPNIIGKDFDYAKKVLTKKGFNVIHKTLKTYENKSGVSSFRIKRHYKKTLLLTRAKKNSTIIVTTYKKYIKIPRIDGLNFEQAKNKIESLGLNVNEVKYYNKPNKSSKKGISTKKNEYAEGDTVYIITYCNLPVVRNLNIMNAKSELKNLGFSVEIEYELHSSIQKNNIINYNIKEDIIKANSCIQLLVSSGLIKQSKENIKSKSVISRGSISGRITDINGKPLAGVKIEIKDNSTYITSTTSKKNGTFFIHRLSSSGSYSVKFSKDNYKTNIDLVKVNSGETTIVNTKLVKSSLRNKNYEVTSTHLFLTTEKNSEYRRGISYPPDNVFRKHKDNRYVWTYLNIKNLQFNEINHEHDVEIVYYSPDGSVLSRHKGNFLIKSEWEYANYKTYFGWESGDKWEIGNYRVLVYLDESKVGDTHFRVISNHIPQKVKW